MIDIKRLREYYNADSVYVTWHASDRFRQRKLKMHDIKSALMSGEIIEQYPDDFPFPSCLILGYNDDNKPIHIVMSDEGSSSNIITAYVPDNENWEVDYKTRKDK